MYPATDTNTTSDQWSCLHKNIIFLVIILILKHVLFRLMQKYLIPGNQLSFMLQELVFLGCHTQIASYRYMFASYSYGCKILQPYGADAFRCGIIVHWCSSNESSHKK